MTETSYLIPLLDAADALPGAAELRRRSYEPLALAPGDVVADIGCGTGLAAAELAAAGGTAIGVDLSEEMIAVARERHPEASFRVADACDLPFGDGELSGYRADKVYHMLPDPAAALAEARRVLEPGGRLVLLGQDWDGMLVDAADPQLTRTIVHARADALPHPRIARSSTALLRDSGFTAVTAEAHLALLTAPFVVPMLTKLATVARDREAITADQADAWIADQTARAAADRLFLAIPFFLTWARRP